MLDIRCLVQIQDVIDQVRRMADLLIGKMAEMLMQSLIAPILIDGRMKQASMNCRQFCLQRLIEKLNDPFRCLH